MNNALLWKGDSLPLAVELRIDALCQTFEAAWKRVANGGAQPRMEDLLNAVAEPERGPLLRELLKVELHHRRADHPASREYRQRFPEHDGLLANLFDQLALA